MVGGTHISLAPGAHQQVERGQPPRVLVLAGAQAFLPDRELVPDLEWVIVSSPYEAAAEIFAAPTLALVLDLRALPPRHRRLLDIAAQMGVEIFVVGLLPAGADAESLSGVRLFGADGLASALGRLAEVAAQNLADESQLVPAPAVPAAQVAAAEPPACSEPSAPAKQQAPAEKWQPAVLKAAPAARPPQPVERPAARIADVLSSEEISALLEGRK